MDAWHAICLARTGLHGPHPLQYRRVGNSIGRWRLTGRRRSSQPWTRRASAPSRQIGNRLVLAHEPEEPDDTAPLSGANHPAAFESREPGNGSRCSRWTCLLLRRKHANSFRPEAIDSALPSPGGPLASQPQWPRRGSTARWAQIPGGERSFAMSGTEWMAYAKRPFAGPQQMLPNLDR